MSERAAWLELVDDAAGRYDGTCDGDPRQDDHRDYGDRRSQGRRFAEGERLLEERVIALCSGAIDSRSVAGRYIESASLSLALARGGRGDLGGAHRENHLDEAGRASRQARKCLRFARLCERRASALATDLDPAGLAAPNAAAE